MTFTEWLKAKHNIRHIERYERIYAPSYRREVDFIEIKVLHKQFLASEVKQKTFKGLGKLWTNILNVLVAVVYSKITKKEKTI